jgi:hypothetical protein
VALAVWPGSPWIDYGYGVDRAVAEIRNGRPGFVRTVELEPLERRVWTIPERLATTDRQAIEAFLRARGWTRDPILIEDPKDGARAGVALEPAVGDGVRTVFSLPTTTASEEYRHYPKQGSVVGRVAGAPATLAGVDTDARTITFAAPPGNGLAVTADFTGLRLVRLRAAPQMRGQTVDWFEYAVDLEEVLREAA